MIGSAIGYRHAQVATFLESLDASGFAGVVMLAMADDLDDEERALIEALGVTIYTVSRTPWISTSRSRTARLARGISRTAAPRSTRLAVTIQGPLSRRWLLYREMAAAFPTLLSAAPWVFLTDVRDVRFQADPTRAFARHCSIAPVNLFAEGRPGADARDPTRSAGATLIGEQPWNAEWIEYVGGARVLDELSRCQVLCAGTILVTPERLDVLAARMLRSIGENRIRTAPLGLDQGAMNYLFHSGALDDLEPTVHANVDGDVFTMGTCPADAWTMLGRQVLVGGTVPAVVHQYDRFPELVDAWSSNNARARESESSRP